MKPGRIIAVLLFMLPYIAMYGAESTRFTRIGTSDGLSNDRVNAILQDSRGLYWFGTGKGLDRFDGSRFSFYGKADDGRPFDCIYCLEEDSDGNIWAGTDGGAVIYDYRMDSFRMFEAKTAGGLSVSNKVAVIKRFGEKMILSVVASGLFVYDMKTGILESHFYRDGKLTIPQGISGILQMPDGQFLCSLYYTGLFTADPELSTLKPLKAMTDDGQPAFMPGDHVKDMVRSVNDPYRIYILSVRRGLCALDLRKLETKTLMPLPEGANPNKIACDSTGRVWVATATGLYVYGPDSKVSCIRADSSDRFSLSDNFIETVYIDMDLSLWVGTRHGGLDYNGKECNDFHKVYRGLEDAVVSGFATGGDGRIWVTTENSGLFIYDPDTGDISPYLRYNPGKGLYSPVFHSGHLWMGTPDGIVRLDTRTGETDGDFRLDKVPDSYCEAIFRTREGRIYAGTTLGLLLFDGSDFNLVGGSEGEFVRAMSEDSSGTLWVATETGGVLAVRGERVEKRFGRDMLGSDKVSSVHVDSRDRVWAIGLNTGIHLYDPGSGTFVRAFDRSSTPDLETDMFTDAVEDMDGNLWAASDRGIVRINVDTRSILNYDKLNGLIDNSVNSGLHIDGDGNIYAGSVNGFTVFNPRRFYTPHRKADIVLTNLTAAGEAVLPCKGPELRCNVDLCDRVVLRQNQNTFSLDFSIPSLPARSRGMIEVFLEGLDKTPRRLQGGGTIVWYNVPTGEYTLKVTGSRNGDEWDMSHRPLKILVKKHFLASGTAIAAYVLVALMLLVSIAAYYANWQRDRERRRMEALEIERETMTFAHGLPTMLLLEDDGDIRRKARLIFGNEFNIVPAMSTGGMQRILADRRADVILADDSVRGFTPSRFFTALGRTGGEEKPIVIILCSTGKKHKVAYMDNGVEAIVDRPFTDNFLRSCVMNQINRRKNMEDEIARSLVSMKIRHLGMDRKDQDFLDMLEKVMLENISDVTFSLDCLEKEMSMSRSTLARKLKSLCGMTPNEYMKRKRLAVAAKMLLSGDTRVNEVCYAVGFKYPSYFTRCFKEIYGVLPAEYVKIHSKSTN